MDPGPRLGGLFLDLGFVFEKLLDGVWVGNMAALLDGWASGLEGDAELVCTAATARHVIPGQS